MRKFVLWFLLQLVCSLSVSGQVVDRSNNTQRKGVLKPYELSEEVRIDGQLREAFWDRIEGVTDFINQYPEDSGRASLQTVVKIAYDEHNLYIGAICYEADPQPVIRTLKRDNQDDYFGSDGLGVVLDPVNRKASGFFFGVNAAGSQIDGLLRNGDFSTRLDVSWDSKWISEVSSTGNTWYLEMAIPFEALSYDARNRQWGVNFVRNDMTNNSFSTLYRVPRNLNAIDIGYVGELVWEGSPPASGTKDVSIIPFVLGGLSSDFENNDSGRLTRELGVDAKIGITSSLNLDLTVNPDFSTVEADRQVTDLSRFSIFFPERRNFFIENSDLFNSFGIGSINPFFSRRIGLQNGRQIPIIFGGRLTGNVTENLRIGVMTVQTGQKGVNRSQNYSVAAFQRSFGQRSSVRGLFVNRQSTQEDDPMPEFNRVAALELSLLSGDGSWGGELGVHKSFNPDDLGNEGYYKFSVQHSRRSYFTRFNLHRVGDNYLTDVGFVPRLGNYDAERDTTIRKGFYQSGYLFGYNFFPGKGSLDLHGPRFSANLNLNLDGSFGGSFAGVYYYAEFRNQNSLELSYRREKVVLPYPSRIVGDIPFPSGTYRFSNAGFWFRFDPRKPLSGRIQVMSGNFYNGTRTFLNLDLNVRIQPWGNFGISYDFNDVRLPMPYGDHQFHLVGPKTEIAFSRDLFWTTFLQYNTQSENVNINSRFQWRYSALSDLYVVYTDNYNSESFAPRNRAVVLKLNYWF